MSPAIRHPKRRGEWVELQFMARAASHGLTVSKPWGDSARYDFIVESNGRFHRVQVKCTSYHDGRGYHAQICGPSDARNGRVYTADEIDFFALFILPEDVWYIIPINELRAQYGVYLNPHDGQNRYFRYMEAWQLLKPRPKRADLATRRDL